MSSPSLGRVGAELLLARGATSAASIDHVRPWLAHAFDEVHPLPPLGVVIDVGRVLIGERTASRPHPTDLARPGLAALLSYEEHVLGRLRADPRLLAAQDALLALAEERRPFAIAVTVASLMHTLRGMAANRPSGPLRRLLEAPTEKLLEAGRLFLAAGAANSAPIAEGYYALAQVARTRSALLSDADVFTLENFETLPTSSDRLALAQTAHAAQLLEQGLSSRPRPQPKRQGHTATGLIDEGSYPAGGFSSLATSGSIENIVSSELVYVEDGQGVDLFDVRYAAGELLKYTRDENVFTRRRRRIVFILQGELSEGRVKKADAPYQELVLICGLVVASTRRLLAWLHEWDMAIKIWVPPGLEKEGEMMAKLLREHVESGSVSFPEYAPSLGTEPGDEWADVVAFARPPSGQPPLQLSLDDDEAPTDPARSENDGLGWARERLDRLLQGLV